MRAVIFSPVNEGKGEKKVEYTRVCVHVRAELLHRVRLFAIPWTVARQDPLSMGIFQERILEWVAMPSWGPS